MKDIGSQFKETRESIGISEDEAASDLGITIAQLQNLEDGNANAFKDIFFLKELIFKYSKYLDIDSELVNSEFNDFIFNLTSKIPVEEIEERVKEIKEDERENCPKKIISPYTRPRDIKTKRRTYLIYIFSFLLIITLIFLITILIKSSLNI